MAGVSDSATSMLTNKNDLVGRKFHFSMGERRARRQSGDANRLIRNAFAEYPRMHSIVMPPWIRAMDLARSRPFPASLSGHDFAPRRCMRSARFPSVPVKLYFTAIWLVDY